MAEVSVFQDDLFSLNSPLYGDVQGERTVAEFPFFALSKKAHMAPMVFESGAARIEINPSKTGVATIYDKEILLYIASLMAERAEKGEKADRVMTFTANDLFRVTGTNSSARSYTSLKASLNRLQGTQIVTNIETGGEGSDSSFSWLLKAASTSTSRSWRRVSVAHRTGGGWNISRNSFARLRSRTHFLNTPSMSQTKRCGRRAADGHGSKRR
jgi:plasmid replication initiation protein